VGKEIRSEEREMSDLISMMAMTPTSGALVVALLMALRIVRALQREPVRSRRASGARLRPKGV
jgi:hypothetical protein